MFYTTLDRVFKVAQLLPRGIVKALRLYLVCPDKALCHNVKVLEVKDALLGIHKLKSLEELVQHVLDLCLSRPLRPNKSCTAFII